MASSLRQRESATIADMKRGLRFAKNQIASLKQKLEQAHEKIIVMHESSRRSSQVKAMDWAVRCFGAETANNVVERVTRILEEATELAQAEGLSEGMAHKIVDYTYSKPVGDPPQEVGGIYITMLVYCQLKGYSADELENRELKRILSKPESHFAARQQSRVDLGVAQTTNTFTPVLEPLNLKFKDPDNLEINRMKAVSPQSQAIGQFLEWLQDQGIQLCRIHAHGESCYDEEGNLTCDISDEVYYPHYESIEKILARHFNIDLDKVEREKQQMLDNIRRFNETHQR